MNAQEGELCVRVLCSIAWADGDLSEEEMASVVDAIDRFDYAERSMAQEILAIPLSYKFQSKVAELSRPARIRLLHDCYALADFCGGVSDPERDIIRSIALTVVDADKWDAAEASLQAWVEYEKLARKVWGWTHLAD